MPVILTPSGPMSVQTTTSSDIVLSSKSPSAGGGPGDRREIQRIESSLVDIRRMQAQKVARAEIQRRVEASNRIAEQRRQQLIDQKKFRQMSAVQRRAFQQSQRDLSTAVNVQRIIQRGGRPTPQALRTFKRVTKVQQIPTIIPPEKITPKKITKPKTIITKGLDFTLRTIEEIESTREKLRKRRVEIIKEKGVKALASRELQKVDAQLQRLAVASTTLKLVFVPRGIIELIKDPKKLLGVPSELKKSATKFGKMALISPSEAVAVIGTEVLLLKGTGKVFKVTGKFSGKTASRVAGSLVKVKGGNIVIKSSKKGTLITRKGGFQLVSKKPVTLKVAKPGLKKITTPLKEQARLVGKRIPIVTSAQAEKLVSIIKRKRVVRKPIPNERLLKPSTKRLLKKFDQGKLTKKQFLNLNRKIRIETKGQGNLLERSFFVDPEGRVRVSRLGIQEEASLLDILKGNFTFKTQKPQIIFFKNIQVQAFPKTKIFNSIKKKLKTNKSLTKKESESLLKFQIKKSGKFKPIGALTKEPELTLAPGEIIKKVKTVAKVQIGGRLVPIVQSKVVKATKKTSLLLKKSKTGKITAKELKELRGRLRKETGFKTPRISRTRKIKPRVPIKRKAISAIIRVPKRRRKPRKKARKVPTRREPRPPRRPPVSPTPTRIVPARPPIRPPKKPPTKPTPRPPKKPPTKPPVRPPKKIRVVGRKPKKPKKKKEVQVFNVFGRSRGKFVRLNKKPLTREDALSRGAFAVDNTTARTFKITSAGRTKKAGSLRKQEKNYFNRSGFKLREQKIRKGRKFQLKNKFIEKRKFGIDTRGEKRGLTIAKFLRGKKRVKRKITPAQRKVMLKNLAKARSARGKK